MNPRVFPQLLPVLVAASAAFLATAPRAEALVFDQNVTPDVIFGTGNANGGFTVGTNDGALSGEAAAGTIEIGLRAKLRFDATNQAQNVFNSNGDGSYTFQAGTPPTGFGFAPGSQSTAVWNFEWSVNTATIGDPGDGYVLDDLVYEIGIDFDPGAGTDFQVFDPIIASYADHAIGDNSTGNGGGFVAANPSPGQGLKDYGYLIQNYHVAQNSWNMEFFDNLSFPFDANATGVYTIYFEAFDNGTNDLLARSEIDVIVVPEPSTWGLLAGIAGVAAVFARRRHA